MKRSPLLFAAFALLTFSGCQVVPRVQDYVDQLPPGEVDLFQTRDLGGYVTVNAEIVKARKTPKEVAFDKLEIEASAPFVGGRTILIEGYRRDTRSDAEWLADVAVEAEATDVEAGQ